MKKLYLVKETSVHVVAADDPSRIEGLIHECAPESTDLVIRAIEPEDENELALDYRSTPNGDHDGYTVEAILGGDVGKPPDPPEHLEQVHALLYSERNGEHWPKPHDDLTQTIGPPNEHPSTLVLGPWRQTFSSPAGFQTPAIGPSSWSDLPERVRETVRKFNRIALDAQSRPVSTVRHTQLETALHHGRHPFFVKLILPNGSVEYSLVFDARLLRAYVWLPLKASGDNSCNVAVVPSQGAGVLVAWGERWRSFVMPMSPRERPMGDVTLNLR